MLNERNIGKLEAGRYRLTTGQSSLVDTLPCFDGGSFDGIYLGGDGCLIICIDNTSVNELEAYAKKLCGEGYRITADNKIGNNSFFTLENDKAYVNAYYIDCTKSVKLIIEPYYKYSAVTPFTDAARPAVIASSCCDRNFYARLPDNTLVIIDGGWRIEDWSLYDMDELFEGMYREMSEILGGEEIIDVSLWIITHRHSDHGRVAQYLYTKKLCEKFRINRILFNFPDDSMVVEPDPPTAEKIQKSWDNINSWHEAAGRDFPYEEIFYNCPFPVLSMELRYGDTLREAFKHYNAEIIKAHTGMKLNLSGVVFEVLHTPDDDMPTVYHSVNDTSIVVKMTYRDSSMLWLGDMGPVPSDSCVRMYGKYLKSDAVQVSHHGWGAATEEFYELASPSILFWNNSEFGFKYADKHQGYGKTAASTKLYDMECVKRNFFCNKITMQTAYLPVGAIDNSDNGRPKLFASSASDRAYYIRTANNKIILIDAGLRADAAKHDWYKEFSKRLYKELSRAVNSERVEIAALISSNAKRDNNLLLAQWDEPNMSIENIVYGEYSELYDGKAERLIKAEVGAHYEFDGVEISIMQTEGSLVFGAICGKKLIFTGEMTDKDSLELLKKYGDSLKCDAVLVANHGYGECGAVDFYRKCAAPVQLWGNSEYGFRFFRKNDGYKKNSAVTEIYHLESCVRNIFCDCITPQTLYLTSDVGEGDE